MHTVRPTLVTRAALACIAALALPAAAELNIVGSSTVYPFTTLVAERYGQIFGGATPKIESTGTGGGFKLFCAGVGDGHPDISNASRAIKDSEVELCAGNGVGSPLEVPIGYDGIVLGQSKTGNAFSITRTQLFMALARELADAAGRLRANPHRTWASIDPALPDIEIRVYGPPPTSGTRDAFVELALEKGCQDAPHMDKLKAADADGYRAACAAIREDGAFIEAGENDNLIIQRLVANPDTLGIFGYSFLEANLDKIQGALVDGAEPTFEAIEQGSYPLSRQLFVYVKKEHAQLKPELAEFIEFFASDASMGADGFLSDRGLVALPADELSKVRAAIAQAF